MTAKIEEFDQIQTPLLVHAEASTEASLASQHSITENDRASASQALASDRQVKGAMWAGGIAGLVIGGPIGAGLGVWGGHHFSKNGDGKIGKFARKAGDFTAKIGANIKREWQESTSDRKE